ncbi:SDR family NAD(P)-dependent oxidoreductase [Schlesneria sp. T3-172]|uniref:SDR family NAD(P)-dependent oxidoreductase n=1 Tax=Schlesneria sphaerica TaxID=3373610 RepID=UPI0037C6354F
MSKLRGKIALVTGASKGIGAGIANELARQGASVVVNYATDKEGADAVVQAITRAGGSSRAAQCDLARESDVIRMFDQVRDAYGRLDILVNNAGVYRSMPIEALTAEEFLRQTSVNVLGPLLTIREPLRLFTDQGGSIINIGSRASTSYIPGYVIYSAAKAGLDAVTGVLAKELASRNIRVNSVNPGATLSEGTRQAGMYGTGSDFEKELIAMTPLGRIGTPEDIARVVAFLASEDAAWLTGEHITASGGL